MNTNLRALIFGVAVAAALTITLDTVVAAEATPVIHLDTVVVTGHRSHLGTDVDADTSVKPIRLEPVVVVGHRSNIG